MSPALTGSHILCIGLSGYTIQHQLMCVLSPGKVLATNYQHHRPTSHYPTTAAAPATAPTMATASLAV